MTESRDDLSAQKPQPPLGLTSTIDLLDRFKQGDDDAVGLLVERSLPPLKRWAEDGFPNGRGDSPKPRTWCRMLSCAPCRA